MSVGEWLRKTGRTTERRQNSADGSPRFWVTFADGTRLPTMPDAQVNYLINNPEFDGEVEVRVQRGEITRIRAVRPL